MGRRRGYGNENEVNAKTAARAAGQRALSLAIFFLPVEGLVWQ